MSRAYGISTNSTIQYNNYVSSQTIGPLSTNQYPFAMKYHSYGTLNGVRPNPPLFHPSQEPVYTEQNTNARQQYLRATSKPFVPSDPLAQPQAAYNTSTGKYYAVSAHQNYIAPIPSSMQINVLKSKAVGKRGMKVGLPADAPYTTKNLDFSSTRSSLRRARSGGCVAPKKKGAIENTSLRNGQVCAWGAFPRQNY